MGKLFRKQHTRQSRKIASLQEVAIHGEESTIGLIARIGYSLVAKVTRAL
ncbi:hypothetical protein BV341_05106 [Pseudomonas syringae pv. actinidiae]|nr:hypothetical protein BV341_05106 [Pseudomonas syringae pv. actinidiae]OSS00244.1 hypothetical protein BV333_05048 [Pseudomonas syringae pv. actinidiae]OSS04605.1 hypothetical protein BV334_05066 [Pseudomonas syringae pv. actinidiae]OSS14349.1 hypothetical protein BV335_05057 [Pseudomonas syringae pv. actinidiae]